MLGKSAAVAVAIALSFPPALSAAPPPAEQEYFGITRSVDLFGEACREISANYVDSVDVGGMILEGIDGMLETLDPYSVFLDERESEELGEMTSSQYAGLGITIATIAEGVYVTSVVDGHTADRAGIRVGDRIVSVDGENLSGKGLDAVRELIRGNAGTATSLRLDRVGRGLFTRKLVREEVRLSTVEHAELFDGIAYLELSSFSSRSGADVRESVTRLGRSADSTGGSLRGIVLDLRGNPGGLLDAAVDVSSLFLPEGSPVLSIKGRSSGTTNAYATSQPPFDAAIPLVVLIDGRSASASEIVAGALQDLDRAVVVGERSFGKGLVQSVIRLPYDHTLKLTTARYYTPSGRLIQKEHGIRSDGEKEPAAIYRTKGRRKVFGGGGIAPDIAVEQPEPPAYLRTLRREGRLFLFARSWRAEHDSLRKDGDGRKALLKGFGKWLDEEGFSYRSTPEKRLAELKVSLEAGAPDDGREEERNRLLEGLAREAELLKEREVSDAGGRVAESLEEELLRHYGREAEARRMELEMDPVFARALGILAAPERYRALLRP